jgi:hypothetical protein
MKNLSYFELNSESSKLAQYTCDDADAIVSITKENPLSNSNVDLANCIGTAGTFGTVGCFCIAASVGTAGTYGCLF